MKQRARPAHSTRHGQRLGVAATGVSRPPLEPNQRDKRQRPIAAGTLTFLFTDVEGSTRLWEHHPIDMQASLTRHDELIELLVNQHDGQVVRPRGEGDSRFAVFQRARNAVAAACAIQCAFVMEQWPIPEPLLVRMALHTGEADWRDGDYYGSDVNRCARLRADAIGGNSSRTLGCTS